jgi:formylglycine-generating enzyme required for sulfatase activity/serine/threonine protein phosphatase PrpC
MALQFELAGSQIDGARDYQEDAFLITHLTDARGKSSALVIVADGMGGHAAGNVASNMAVQAFNKHVSANYPTDKPAKILRECVLKANSSIQETIKETPALAGMGCTMVAAILESDKLWWASVGDSHLYLIRNKELIKKNADHSYGGFLDRMAAAGTPMDPEPGLSRNMLMSAITGEEINEIDVSEEPFELQEGDRIIICSDGLDTLSDGKIIQYSEWSDSPKECSEALMQAVQDAGLPKQDNTTAVVVNIKKAGQAAAAASPPPAAAEADVAAAVEQDLEITYDKLAVEEAAPVSEPVPEAVEEIEAEPARKPEAPPEPGPAPSAAPIPPPAAAAAGARKKFNMGMIIGIAAVVIIAIGAGVFLMMGGKQQIPQPSPAVTERTESVTEAPQSATEEESTEAQQTVAAAPRQEQVEAVEKTPGPEQPATTKTTVLAEQEIRDTLKDGSPAPSVVILGPGTLEMGSPGTSRFADERPRHTVNIKKFAISKYEITFAQYDKFAKASKRTLPDNLYMDRATHPVIYVSWDDAYYYAKWLSEQTGRTYRLPSEAEWEYAAGAGNNSSFWWGYDEKPNMAHCFGCATGLDPRKPTKVGSFNANSFNIYDSAGNVAEWVQDCWHDNYVDAPANGSVWEGGDCAYRVVRGGAYSSPPQSLRTSKRDKFKSDQAYDHIGIRIVRELD